MKLHLPKQLFSALLSAITLAAAPLALTLGSNAWGGWDTTEKDVYKFDPNSTNTSNLEITTEHSGHASGPWWLRAYDSALWTSTPTEAYIKRLTVHKAANLNITGQWNNSAAGFRDLTIEELVYGAGSGSLTVGTRYDGNESHCPTQSVTIRSITGILNSLTIGNNNTLTIRAATVGTVSNAGTLNLRGTLTGSSGKATISGNGAINVEVDNLSIMDYAGVTYTLADGTSSSKNYGFITGTQSLTIFDNISYNSEKVTINNSTNNSSATFADGKYSADYSDNSAFYVNDTWTYSSSDSIGATAYYIGSNGVMLLEAQDGDCFFQKDVTVGGSLIIKAQDAINYNGSLAITIDRGTLQLDARQTVDSNHKFQLINGQITGAGGSYNNGTYTAGLDLHDASTMLITSSGTSVISTGIGLRDAAGVVEFTVLDAGDLLTVSGVIAGSGSVKKSGAGTLILGGVNTFSGSTSITQGTLAVTQFSALGTGKVTVSDKAVLDLTNAGYSFHTENSKDFENLLISLNTNSKVTTHDSGYIKVDGTPSGDISMQSDMKLRTNMVTTDQFVLHGRSWHTNHSNGHILTIDEGAHLQIGESGSKGLELVGRATINLVNGSSLTAGTLTLGHSDSQTTTSWGKLSIHSGSSAKLSNIVYRKNAGNTFEMTDGSVEFTTNQEIISTSGGVGDFVISGGEWVVNENQNLTQVSGLTVSLGNVDMNIAAEKTITFGGNIAITGALTHNSAGTLKFADNTSLSLSPAVLGSNVEITDEDDVGDGFGSFKYQLVNGTGRVEYGSGISVSGAGYTFSNGIISSSSKVYVINSIAKNTGNVDTSATAYHVNEGGVFTLNGGIAGGLTLSKLLTTTTGKGTLVLGADATITGNTGTIFAGLLRIDGTGLTGNAYRTLSVGNTPSNKTNLASFNEIQLKGQSKLHYHSTPEQKTDIQKLTVMKNSKGWLYFADSDGHSLEIGEVSLGVGAEFKINGDWQDSAFNIAKLTGSGKLLSIRPGKDGSSVSGDINISSLQGFTGDIELDNENNNNKYNATINTGAEGTVDFRSLTAKGSGTVFNVQTDTIVDTITAVNGTVNLSKGVTLTLGGDTASTSTLGTVVAHTGGNTIHLNEKATLNRIASVTGGVITLTGSGTYDLGNNHSVNVSGLGDSSKWNGTIRISSAKELGGVNLNDYGNSNSTLELSGVSCWLTQRTVNVNLHLVNKDSLNNGLLLTGTDENKTYTFGGEISGNGNLHIGNGNGLTGNRTFEFTNDLSDWSGQLVIGLTPTSSTTAVNSTVKLTYAGDVENTVTGTSVNPEFFSGADSGIRVDENHTGTLTVEIGNSQTTSIMNGSITNVDAAGVTHGKINLDVKGNTNFKGAVNVTELTSTTGKKVEFHANTTVAGNVTSGGTIHVEDGTFTVGGTLNAIGKTVELSGASTGVEQGTMGKTTAKIRLEGTGNTVGTLDFGKNGYARGVLELGESSSTTAGALYMNNGVSISLEKNAKLTIGSLGSGYTITGLGADSQIGIDKYGDSKAEGYKGQFTGDNKVKYILSNVDVNVNKASADNTLAYELDNSSLTNAGSGTLTVSNEGNTITHLAADGGNVTLSESMSVNSISAKNEKVVTVSSGKTIGMAGGKVRLSTREGANATLTAKSDNALLQLQADTSFSISDMTLSGVKISAAADTEVVLSGVDTKGGVELAAGQFTMGDTVTLSVQEPATKSGGYTASFSSNQLSGITLNNADGASLTVDLGSLPESLTMGQTYDMLTITLYGFTMDTTVAYEAGKGLIFAEDSWLGRLLADQGASEYVSSIDSPEVAALANNNTVKVEFTSAGTGENVGTVIRITGLTIPEPATTTLGLVALAALVTRRRRK